MSDSLSEFQLIQQCFAGLTTSREGVAVGIGDDGAILDVPDGYQLVSVMDTLVEGVHFPVDISPEDLGYRSLAVNLSDLAAMGAVPKWFTLALTLPSSNSDWLQGFAKGLKQLADQYAVALVGGDTTKGPLAITIQGEGFIPRGQGILRSGAQVGDVIAVSGRLGGGAGGLYCWQNKIEEKQLRDVFFRPTPQVALGQKLRGIATSAIDISDGLAQDLQHICQQSEVGARVQLDQLPIYTELNALVGKKKALNFALHGGDDYQLLFTLAKQDMALLQGEDITIVGEVTEKKTMCFFSDREEVKVQGRGYQHF